LNEGRLRVAVNRAYYAVFHLATAALLWHEVERSKHSGIESAFGEHLVKKKIIEPIFADIYRRCRKVREDADYEPWLNKLTLADATKAVADAERFVQRIETYLQNVGAI